MHVLALRFELHIPESQSLKQKRSVLKPLTEGVRHRFSVSVAEVAHQNLWQRAGVGVAIVSPEPGTADELGDRVERFVWSLPGLEVIGTKRQWMDTGDLDGAA